MPSPEHVVLNHQEKLVCAERVLQESLGELEALIPSHDLNAKKAPRGYFAILLGSIKQPN
jgi:hypothetical protein